MLVAEDEENLAQILTSFLRGRGHQVVAVDNGRAALEAARDLAFDVALLDIVMPELDGLEVLRQLRAESDPPEVIIITGNGTLETAITAMKLGASDYMSKPYRMAEIDVLVKRAWEKRHLARENRHLQARLSRMEGLPGLITRYAPMQAVLAVVERVAASDTPVLVSGEVGTGKTLLARALHRISGRPGPFIECDAAILPDHALDVELFGHERGAFSGAASRKAGLLEIAGGGTLFIDDVDVLGAKLQAKLVRALEHGSFLRIAGTQKVEVAARLVSATSQDLEAAMRENRFRADLFYRLNTVTIALPPLRERTVDVPLLAEHFLRQFTGPAGPSLTPDATAALEEYSWPGNVRELQNVIERAALLAKGQHIGAQDLPFAGDGSMLHARGATLAELERQHILAVLSREKWHQGNAAKALGISPKTLYRKIREYGFRRPRSQ